MGQVASRGTDQHDEFMCLGAVEDAVGSNGFPEVFVDVVVSTAVDGKERREGRGGRTCEQSQVCVCER